MKRRARVGWTRRTLRLGILAAVILFIMKLVGFGDRLFYYPDAAIYGTPADYGLEVDDVAFSAPGGPTLDAWWAGAIGPAKGTVVFCHGNAANITNHADFVAWLPRRGFNLLIFDYRGYGKSGGRVSRAGTVADTLAAIDFALARDPDRTVVYGHSLGGAVGLVAAASRPAVRGIVAESTFPTYRDVARAAAPLLSPIVPFCVSCGFDPEDALPWIPPRPLLVIHGTADHIVPFRLGQRLFDLAREPKQFYEVRGGEHETAHVTEGAGYEERLCAFFEDAIRR